MASPHHRTVALICMTLAMGLACKEPCPKDFCITQVSTVVNAIHFNYVVEAKIYPEDPNTLFLTARGGGLTTLDVSEPASPVVLTHWDAPTTDSNDVEGQDRLGDLLVVVGRNGYVHLLDSSDPANISQIGFLDIPGFDGTFAALHVKIYSHHSGKQYAIVTSAKSDRLIAIDITNPENPTLANTIETGIHGLEGIFVANLVQEDEQRGYAFVGGYRSTRFSAIDLTNVTEENEGLAPMRVVKSLDDPHYVEMVSEMDAAYPGVLFCALWGERSGGLATFDISDPENLRELDHVETLALARANRVKIQGDYAFLPLEQETGGGIGIVNVSDPSNLGHPTWKLDIDGVSLPYTLAVKGDYIYVFGVREKSMAILKMSPR